MRIYIRRYIEREHKPSVIALHIHDDDVVTNMQEIALVPPVSSSRTIAMI
jgi:hypothetical protein